MNGIPLVIKATPKSKRPKGLPKRTGKKKAGSQSRYDAIQRRKAARKAIQDAAHARNVERGYTEWDLAREARRAARAARG